MLQALTELLECSLVYEPPQVAESPCSPQLHKPKKSISPPSIVPGKWVMHEGTVEQWPFFALGTYCFVSNALKAGLSNAKLHASSRGCFLFVRRSWGHKSIKERDLSTNSSSLHGLLIPKYMITADFYGWSDDLPWGVHHKKFAETSGFGLFLEYL